MVLAVTKNGLIAIHIQTGDERTDIFHAGGLFPLWQNITPSEIETNETAALEVFEGIRYIAGKYAGSPSVATLLETALSELHAG
jgi:alpha,alpha-trehalase